MTGTLGIVALVDVCAEMRARNLALFRVLGEAVAAEPDPVVQRWFAVASHRHAWHAELWDERLPRIPVAPSDVEPPTATPAVEWYRGELDRLIADLTTIEASVDPTLDPATVRVITLVRADLDALRAT